MDMWNVKMSNDDLDELFGKCEKDDEGHVSYTDMVSAMNNAFHGKDMKAEAQKVRHGRVTVKWRRCRRCTVCGRGLPWPAVAYRGGMVALSEAADSCGSVDV